MKENCKALTAFTIKPLGFYECDRMPFGLNNAPTTFKCLMQSCLGNPHLQNCIIYLDDIVIFSKIPKEHLDRLRAVFESLKEAKLKLKPSKCEFFKQKLMYLGHVVSVNGIQTDPKKVEVIQKWPISTNVIEVCSFLGFTKFYCRLIWKYAQVAKPLYKLISGKSVARKQNLIKWHHDCQEAFDKLKELCTSTAIWPMQISRNHSGYIQMQAFLALKQSHTKNKMVLKRLSVMPIIPCSNLSPSTQSTNWNSSEKLNFSLTGLIFSRNTSFRQST